jgi:hypothetical protein
MNRRTWLSLLAASSAYILTPPLARAALEKKQLRYGLFFDPNKLDTIRNNYRSNPLFAELRDELASFDFEKETEWVSDVRTNDQLVGQLRLGNLIETAAMIWLLIENPRAVQFVRTGMEKLMEFERWDFFLDGNDPIAVQRASQATVVTALVVDFLGDMLEPEERTRWLRTMWQRGCLPAYRTIQDIRYPQQVEGWRFDPESTFFEHRPGNRTDKNRRPEITINTNLRAVPASALLIGTTVYTMEFGENKRSREFMDAGIWGIEDFREFYKADGSYDEEVNYANYTALHLAQAIIAMKRSGGPDMTDLIDWNAYADYQLNMAMPTDVHPYAVVNWGDSGGYPHEPGRDKRTSLPAWIAATYNNPQAQALGTVFSGTQTHWAALWQDPSVPVEMPPDGPRLWVSELDRVVARNGFRSEHLVVAMRSGPPANHEHADRNSIIVKCFGEELVTDPLRPPYSYSDPSWKMRLTEGHSAVLIDGKGHQHHNGVEGTNASNAFARIVRHRSDEEIAYWLSDATQPYRLVDTDIKSVRRAVAVIYGVPAVVIVDRVSKWADSSSVSARFFGYNLDDKIKMESSAYGFRIRRPGAHLRAHVWSNANFVARAARLDVAEDYARRHPFVEVRTDASQDLYLVTVLAIAPTGQDAAQVVLTPSDGSLSIALEDAQYAVDFATLDIKRT